MKRRFVARMVALAGAIALTLTVTPATEARAWGTGFDETVEGSDDFGGGKDFDWDDLIWDPDDDDTDEIKPIGPGVPEPGNPFVDVPMGAYYHDPVLWAVENGITTGTSPNTFSPDDVCTRGQIVTFLWRVAGSPSPQTTGQVFNDVTEGAYYYNAVAWAVEEGITTGTSPTTFSPDDMCTRGQAVTFLYRFAKQPAVNTDAATPFVDVADGAYYNNPVRWAVEGGITTGTSQSTFSPDDVCTRGQIVTFLYRQMN